MRVVTSELSEACDVRTDWCVESCDIRAECKLVKHAFNVVYSPGGPSVCPASALFSRSGALPPAADNNSDPQPSRLRRQNFQAASAPSGSTGSSTAAGSGAPSGALFSISSAGGGFLPQAVQGPTTLRASSRQKDGSKEEGSEGS